MVDTGCTTSISSKSLCHEWETAKVQVKVLGQDKVDCIGRSEVELCLGGRSVKVDTIVRNERPLGYDFILGMNAICALGGVRVSADRGATFLGCEPGSQGHNSHGSRKEGRVMGGTVEGGNAVCTQSEGKVEWDINEKDFLARFDSDKRRWVVRWLWADGKGPATLKNKVPEYKIPKSAENGYNEELQAWIREGWLVPYDESLLGPPRGLIPLMAVVQPNKAKVRPVLDFREMNRYVSSYTGDADLCAVKLREWRRKGKNGAILDLRTAYFQLMVDQCLWAFQTVVYKGQRYALTRMGFGVCVGPRIMTKILNFVLAQADDVAQGTSSYVDDIYVDQEIVSTERVIAHLKAYGLSCKEPESIVSGARVLGLHVEVDQQGKPKWSRDNDIGEIVGKMTRREVFAMSGRLLGHLPIGGWLRVAAAYIKRLANQESTGWDDEIKSPGLRSIISEVFSRIADDDPAKGSWEVEGNEAVVWVDASSLALGVCIEANGNIIEDMCWLRDESNSHINMAELDAVIKGVNLAILWNMKTLHVKTDSVCVLNWVVNTLECKARVKTKAASEMLIRRRLGILKALVDEYHLSLDISLVPSARNRADQLTRVPEKWLRAHKNEICASGVEDNSVKIRKIHIEYGHPGIRRTKYFCKKLGLYVSKREVSSVLSKCSECASIDPAPVRWKHGELSVQENWQRLAIDVTHLQKKLYLSLVDCGPSRFAIWRELGREDGPCIVRQLESVFYERGPCGEILADNALAFTGRVFEEFCRRWGVKIRYRCAYVPSGNAIVERNHRTVKRTVSRTGCSVAEAVYIYNISPLDDVTSGSAPGNRIYSYEMGIRGARRCVPSEGNESDVDNRFSVGDKVWVKVPGGRCDMPYAPAVVEEIISPQSVKINGTPRHVREIRRRYDEGVQLLPVARDEVEEEEPLLIRVRDSDSGSEPSEDDFEGFEVQQEDNELRRGVRTRRPPTWYNAVW